MNNNQHKDLDQFFQDKLNDRQFEYQDDFWAEMETLLPEENTDIAATGNSRRRFIWGTLLVLLIGFTGWFTYPYVADSTENQTKTVSEIIPSPTTTKEISDNSIIDSNTEINNNKVNTSNHITEETTKKTTDNQWNSNQSTNNVEIKKHDEKSNTHNANTFSEKDFVQPNQLLNPKKGILFPSDRIKNSTKETTKVKKEKPLATLLNIDKKSIDKNQVKNPSELENPLNNKNTTDKSSIINTVDNSNTNQVSDYSYLTTLSLTNISKKGSSNISKVEPTCDGCPRLPDLKSINIGLIAGFTASHGWKNSLSNRANPSLDPTIGLRFEYIPNPIAEWTFNSEIIYWSRSSLNAQYGYDSTSYGFGATTVSRKINIEELHNITLPIYAVYNKDKHQFLGGLSLNYIINAQSTTTGNGTFYNANNVELFNVASTQQWGYTSAFNRLDVGLTIGYDYKIKEGWNIGTRINYGLTDVAKNNVFNNNTFDNNLNIRLLLTCDLFEFKF